MPKVTPDKSQNIEKMLGKLKRKVADAGVIAKVREREVGYIGPSKRAEEKSKKARQRKKKGGGYKNGN